jgi:hypothetical protein
LTQFLQALTNERLHDKCFVCGPNGTHYQPLLPPYPDKWDPFIYGTLTVIAVHDGDFMKFGGVSAVTLNGNQTYHRIFPVNESQHAICWFIYNPSAMVAQGKTFQIPEAWIAATLAGLQRVNPYTVMPHYGELKEVFRHEHQQTNGMKHTHVSATILVRLEFVARRLG